jgi:hypothetical protein
MKLFTARTATIDGRNLGPFSAIANSRSEALTFIACVYHVISDKPARAIPLNCPWFDEDRCIVSESKLEGGKLTMEMKKVMIPQTCNRNQNKNRL